jgi:hypothetical protein
MSEPMETLTQPLAQVDEVSPIAAYILKEMASNAGGRDALQMLGLNTIAHADCGDETPLWKQLLDGPALHVCAYTTRSARSFAYARWAMQVRQNGPWDHKPHIGKKFPAQRPYHHRYHGRTYYYDIWSNIHYGYVGRACGFTRGELLDGAGLEQIGSTLLRGGWPTEERGVEGMRRFDDPSDRHSIQIGIDLYPQLPSIPVFLQILEKTSGLSP